MEREPRHQCMIYEGSPAKHLSGIAALIQRMLRENRRCLYLNSPPMVAGLRSYLAAAGLDVAQEVAKGALVLSSEQTHLVDGHFDVDRMLGMLADAVNQAFQDGCEGLWASGDMTWEFGPEKNFDKLLEYEYGLEELFRRNPALSGICQYHQDTLPTAALSQALHVHPMIYIGETLSRLNPYYTSPELLVHPQSHVAAVELGEILDRLHQPVD
jgi:hypothetical protein